MKKILIIEDDQSLASAYRFKLSSSYETRNAVTGDDGLKEVHGWKPDLILLDLFLPGKSGQEVLAELKKHNKTKDIPVIVLTNLEGQNQAMIKQGADECLIKTDTSMDQVLK